MSCYEYEYEINVQVRRLGQTDIVPILLISAYFVGTSIGFLTPWTMGQSAWWAWRSPGWVGSLDLLLF